MMNNINLQIDAAARQVSQNGKAVYLTQTEFDLLLYLLDNAGRITTRSELLAQVWGTLRRGNICAAMPGVAEGIHLPEVAGYIGVPR